MKNDINLLSIRKNASESAKKRKTILFTILFLSILAAGIILPSQTRMTAQARLDKLTNQLSGFSVTQEDVDAKTVQAALTAKQLADLQNLHQSRSDILSYLSGIESAKPSNLRIVQLVLEGNSMTVLGQAENDAALADFCLRLRDSGMFLSVFVETSTALSDEDTSTTVFKLFATLPQQLEGNAIVEDGNAPFTDEEADFAGTQGGAQ